MKENLNDENIRLSERVEELEQIIYDLTLYCCANENILNDYDTNEYLLCKEVIEKMNRKLQNKRK